MGRCHATPPVFANCCVFGPAFVRGDTNGKPEAESGAITLLSEGDGSDLVRELVGGHELDGVSLEVSFALEVTAIRNHLKKACIAVDRRD